MKTLTPARTHAHNRAVMRCNVKPLHCIHSFFTVRLDSVAIQRDVVKYGPVGYCARVKHLGNRTQRQFSLEVAQQRLSMFCIPPVRKYWGNGCYMTTLFGSLHCSTGQLRTPYGDCKLAHCRV
ncbi:hypothetical protein F2P81_003785 [Scophthalmus maximus]|uniref:Uncharacterized protein n=1 Tax=Scophthalmus maximus TaxID=52904 RepID=A0A6A4TDJ1_SCOMX|nr:hypothetical protein F2P81_003785 [Scophthalmus maximus]